MTAMGASDAILVRKHARDMGFDLAEAFDGPWLRFESTSAPVRAWVALRPEGRMAVALSMAPVVASLDRPVEAVDGVGAEGGAPWPRGAAGVVTVVGDADLRATLRRAHQLSRSLPSHPLDEFRRRTAALPAATEAERLQIVRVGQDLFRQGLIDFWDGACAVTGLGVGELLRASHAKPWAVCESDAERLDVHNGLLLAPHLDAAFDRGYVTVTDDGDVVISPRLDGASRAALGMASGLRVRRVVAGHLPYFAWHRAHVFR